MTLTVTDVNGATAICNATVTDATLPTVVCQNITLQLDARPYSLDNAGGVAGTPKTITFQVVSSTLARQAGNSSPILAEPSIQLYPNPATESVTLRMEGPNNELVEALVLDSWGRKIYTRSWTKDQPVLEKELDLSELAEGMYFIQIRQGTYQTVERIMKMK